LEGSQAQALDGSEDVIAAFGSDERLWIGVSGFGISI
jgi:hypothetical protein